MYNETNMGIFSRKVETRADEEVPVSIIPPAPGTLTSINPETAMNIGSCARAIGIIVTMGDMPLIVKKEGVTLNTPALIRQPNFNDTQSRFIHETLYSLAGYGEFFWRVYRTSPQDKVQNLEVLDPSIVVVDVDQKTGKRTYHIGAGAGQQTDIRLQDWQIKHGKLFSRPGRVRGIGPIQMSPKLFDQALKVQEFGSAWFDLNSIPQGVLKNTVGTNATRKAEVAKAWNAFLKDLRGTGVLDGGWEYEAIQLKPIEGQMVEVANMHNVAVARAFGISNYDMMVEVGGTSQTYTNLVESRITFMQHTLKRYVDEIRFALATFLPRGQEVYFDTDNLLRGDAVTEWGIKKIQSELGYTSGAELRELEGKEPLKVKAAEKPNTSESSEE